MAITIPTTQRPLWPLVILVLIGIAVTLPGVKGCPAGGTVEAKPPGPDMVVVFKTNDDRAKASEHAHTMETILASLADVIEYDGKQTTPQLITGVKFDQLRRTMRQYRMGGWSYAQQYPDLGAAIESYMTEHVGTSGGPVDTSQRQKWVDALRALSKCCGYASRQG